MLWVGNSGRAFLRGWAERSRRSKGSQPCGGEERVPVEGAAGAKALSEEEVGVSGAGRRLEQSVGRIMASPCRVDGRTGTYTCATTHAQRLLADGCSYYHFKKNYYFRKE